MYLLIALILLALPSAVLSQVRCFDYGGMVSCDGPSGNTLITPFSPGNGVIMQRGEWGSSITPYTVFEAPRVNRDLNKAIAPLKPLPSTRNWVDETGPGLSPILSGPSLLDRYRGEEPPGVDLGLDLPPLPE